MKGKGGSANTAKVKKIVKNAKKKVSFLEINFFLDFCKLPVFSIFRLDSSHLKKLRYDQNSLETRKTWERQSGQSLDDVKIHFNFHEMFSVR